MYKKRDFYCILLLMKIVIQNVLNANISIDTKQVSEIKRGFLLFVGLTQDDNEEIVRKLAEKVAKLRIFEDENGKTNLSLKDINGEILSVSQFTLYANASKGNRPDFLQAMEPHKANELYEYFNETLRSLGFVVKTGVFSADMKVNLVNDGPFTLILDSKEILK